MFNNMSYSFTGADKDIYAAGFSRLVERWERCMLKSNITVRIVRLPVVLLGLLVLELIERPL